MKQQNAFFQDLNESLDKLVSQGTKGYASGVASLNTSLNVEAKEEFPKNVPIPKI